VHKISEAMADIVRGYGGTIELNTSVKEVVVEKGRATGVILADGRILEADTLVLNADFAHAMKHLIKEKDRPSYKDKKINNMKYSCSTLMFYFGLGKKYDIAHHNIIFGGDYHLNVDEIFNGKGFPTDPAFYMQNASILDPTLAPEGKSTLYILVPVSNLVIDFDWEAKKKEIRDFIVKQIKEKTELKDFDRYIEEEKIITPRDWEIKKNIHKGAVFNLAHNVMQMLYLRPHNRFDDIKNLYLVGGGTHPGSGLPTILESGRIAAQLISEE
jgi:phytoene desaturase